MCNNVCRYIYIYRYVYIHILYSPAKTTTSHDMGWSWGLRPTYFLPLSLQHSGLGLRVLTYLALTISVFYRRGWRGYLSLHMWIQSWYYILTLYPSFILGGGTYHYIWLQSVVQDIRSLFQLNKGLDSMFKALAKSFPGIWKFDPGFFRSWI